MTKTKKDPDSTDLGNSALRLPPDVRKKMVEDSPNLLGLTVLPKLQNIKNSTCPRCGDTTIMPQTEVTSSGFTHIGRCLSCGTTFTPETEIIVSLGYDN